MGHRRALLDAAETLRRNRKTKTFARPCGSVMTCFVQSHEIYAQIHAAWIFSRDSFDGLDARFLWTHSLAHQLHDQERSAIAHDIFADAGRARRANVVIHIKTAANNRRVTDSSGHFSRESAGGAAARNRSIFAQRKQADRVVILFAAFGAAALLWFGGVSFVPQNPVQAFSNCESFCAFAHEHHVRSLFHDAARYVNRMRYFLQGGDTSRFVSGPEHDARIQLDDAGRIRLAPEAHRTIRAIIF